MRHKRNELVSLAPSTRITTTVVITIMIASVSLPALAVQWSMHRSGNHSTVLVFQPFVSSTSGALNTRGPLQTSFLSEPDRRLSCVSVTRTTFYQQSSSIIQQLSVLPFHSVQNCQSRTPEIIMINIWLNREMISSTVRTTSEELLLFRYAFHLSGRNYLGCFFDNDCSPSLYSLMSLSPSFVAIALSLLHTAINSCRLWWHN